MFSHGSSENAEHMYLNSPFMLKLPTIDHVTKHVKFLGRGYRIHKVDIKCPFRHVNLDPKEYDLLGLYNNRWFLDTSIISTRYHHCSATFQCLSDTVRHIMCQHHVDVINYIDDILGIDVHSKINSSFDAFYQLLLNLDFEISEKELCKPSTCGNCLGILVNSETFTKLEILVHTSSQVLN